MLVVLLALSAAVLSAVSAAGEHRAATRSAQVSGLRGIAFVWALLTSPLWLISWSIDVASFFMQAAALHLGSLSVVQPLMISTLLFTLPLAAAERRQWPTARDWTGTVAVSIGLAMVLSTRRIEESSAEPTPALLPAIGVLAVLIVVLVAVSGRGPVAVRTALMSVAAGLLFGVGAAALKLSAATVTQAGLGGLLTGWAGYVLTVATIASFGLQQFAYGIGPLATVMTVVMILDPLTSYVLGVVGFAEPWPAGVGPLALTAAGVLLLTWGIGVLARSPLLRPAAPGREAASPPDGLASGRG